MQLVLVVLCPDAPAAAASSKVKKSPKSTASPATSSPASASPPSLPAELTTTLAWYWADCALQAEELGLSAESLHRGWAALASLHNPSPADGAECGEKSGWERAALVRAAAATQVALSDAEATSVAANTVLRDVLSLAKAISFGVIGGGGGSTQGDWEFVSYLPVLCLRHIISIAGREGVCDSVVEEHMRTLSQLWAAVQALLVQKPTADAPSDAQQAAQLSARLACFSRGLAHVATVAAARLKQTEDRRCHKALLPAVVECALLLLGRTLLDAKCVPNVRRGLAAFQSLLGPAVAAAVDPSALFRALATLLSALFKRARDLPEPERVEVCSLAHVCAVLCGNNVLKSSSVGPSCEECTSLLVSVVGGTFAVQSSPQRVVFGARRGELLRLLSRYLLHRYKSDDEPCTGELSQTLQESLSALVSGHDELRSELKMVFSALTCETLHSVDNSARTSGCVRAVLRVVCDASDFGKEDLILSSSLHWSGAQVLSAQEVDSLLTGFKLALTEADPEGTATVFSSSSVGAQKKSTVAKAKKEVSTDSADAQLTRACWRLRLWTARAAWADVEEVCETSAGSGKLDDPESSQMGLKGRCLVAAVRALHSAELLLQKSGQQAISSRAEVVEACYAFARCSRALFAMLYLCGRLTDVVSAKFSSS